MSKHHLKNLAEQIAAKGYGSAPFHHTRTSHQVNEPIYSGNSQMKGDGDGSSVQAVAYQIYQEKGGFELDNWLEAERIVRNNGQVVSKLRSVSNPNIQK